MYRFGAPIWQPEINKNIWGSLFLLKLFPFTRKLAYVGINIPSNTLNGYTAENQEERLFFNETAIPGQRSHFRVTHCENAEVQITVFSK